MLKIFNQLIQKDGFGKNIQIRISLHMGDLGKPVFRKAVVR
jgi:hypothetical protein